MTFNMVVRDDGLEVNSKKEKKKKKKGRYQCIQTHAKISIPFKSNSGQPVMESLR